MLMLRILVVHLCINCTVVELKLPRPASVPSGSSGINCTVVELKPRTIHVDTDDERY